MYADWEKEMIAVSIVYRMAEWGEKLPLVLVGTKWDFIEEIVDDMHRKDFLEVDDEKLHYALTKKGKELLTRIVGMVDQALKFEIFSSYNFELEIPEDCYEEGKDELRKDTWDYRFDPDHEGVKEDLRLAMMQYVSETITRAGKGGQIDPHRVVFLQQLANGDLKDHTDDFWRPTRLAEIFTHVDKIVETAYKWQDLGDTVDESYELAGILYAAGMVEVRKQEGPSCGECDTPLAMYETDGKELENCPKCDAYFGSEPAEVEGDTFECPNCGRDIHEGQDRCFGCGAQLDFGLPAGTVETSTETTTEEVYEDYDDGYGYYYGYYPYGWYSPYDPVFDAVAFGVLCGAILL